MWTYVQKGVCGSSRSTKWGAASIEGRGPACAGSGIRGSSDRAMNEHQRPVPVLEGATGPLGTAALTTRLKKHIPATGSRKPG